MKKIIHVCFSASAMGNLKRSMKQGLIKENRVINLIDDLSNGPINDLSNINKRILWQTKITQDHLSTKQMELNYYNFYNDIKNIENEDIYIWYGENSMELCGLFYTLTLLKDRINNIFTVNISKEIYGDNETNETIIMHSWVGEVPPERLKWFNNKKEKLEMINFNHYKNLWLKLKQENSNLRIISNNNLSSVPEDYFDNLIFHYTNNTYVNIISIIGNVLINIDNYTSDAFISWRISELIKQNKIDFRGNLQEFFKLEIINI